MAFGADAGEVLAAMQTAMLAGLPYPKLHDAVIAHMTTAEGLGLLLENVPPRSTASLRQDLDKSSTPQTPKAANSFTSNRITPEAGRAHHMNHGT